ncbi:MAG: FIST signal transduction protein [Halobaculum sp.]
MISEFVSGTGGRLDEASRRLARDAEGILVLVREDIVVRNVTESLHSLTVPVFGGVFPEVIYEGDRTAEGVVLVGLDRRPTVTTVTELSDPETSVRDQLDSTVLERDHETAFVLVDSHTFGIGAFVRQLFDTYGVEMTFLGGGTGRLDGPDDVSVFTAGDEYADAAVVATVPTRSAVGVNHGWERIEGPFRVTSADGTTIETLDGRPAFDVYTEALALHEASVDKETFFETVKGYPFGISRAGDETIVRDSYAVTDENGIRCFGGVPEGEFLHLLRGESDRMISAAAAADTVAGDGGTVAFFDCISRVLYLEDEFTRELEVIGGETEPTFGALTIGEIANDGRGHLEYYNKTSVVARIGTQ